MRDSHAPAIDANDVSSAIERIAGSADPTEDLVRAIRALGRSGLSIDPVQLATLSDRPEPPVRNAVLKLLKVVLDEHFGELAKLARDPALDASTVGGAQRLIATVAAHDRDAVRELVAALATEHLHPTAADAVRRAADRAARRRSWPPLPPASLDAWPHWRRATWRNAMGWVEAQLGRKPVVALYLSAGVDFDQLNRLVAEPPPGLPTADVCVYVDRNLHHVPDRSEVRFAGAGREVPFLGRQAHLAELHPPATAGAAGSALLLTVQASNEEVCQHANRERWAPDIVLAIRDGCGAFGDNLHSACPNDLRRPLLQQPPKWWVTQHGIRTEGGPWELEPHTPPVDGEVTVWSVRRRRSPARARRRPTLPRRTPLAPGWSADTTPATPAGTRSLPMSTERHLLYDSTEIETLVFAPAGVVREVAAIHEHATQWETWGDARRDLTAERFDELRENQWGSGEPDEDEALDTEQLTGEQPLPALDYAQVAAWLPEAVVATHGEHYEGALDSGIHFPADAEQKIIEELEALGYRCTNQHGLEELFDLAG